MDPHHTREPIFNVPARARRDTRCAGRDPRRCGPGCRRKTMSRSCCCLPSYRRATTAISLPMRPGPAARPPISGPSSPTRCSMPTGCIFYSIRYGCLLSARRWRAGSALSRFLAFCAVTAAAGALAHLMTHFGQMVPMVGASGAISGTMSGAMRFAFQRGGPLTFGSSAQSYRVPALSLVDSFRDPRVLTFLAVWFGLNLLFGLGSVSMTGNEQPVAWQAHVGGFLAGLVAVQLVRSGRI